ncbi:MAG: epimerase protein [Rhizobium sp.]|nr:epimerase protein [Rhizobium sp.]
MATILLTGASGFVGRQIAKALYRQGHGLKMVLRPGGLVRSGFSADGVNVVETTDLFAEDSDWWARHLEGVDCVIHSAWYVEPGKYLDSPANIDCAIGTLAMADAAIRAGVRHFIGIGTCFEYRLPNAEITAQSELGPVTLYAAAKLALYQMLDRRFAGSGVIFTWARLFYLFGEGEHPARLFPTLHRKLSAGEPMLLSSGDKIRDFLDVAIAGELIATLAQTGQAGVANICSGRPVTIRDIALEIADIHGRRDLLEFGTATVHPRDPAAVAGQSNVLPAK